MDRSLTRGTLVLLVLGDILEVSLIKSASRPAVRREWFGNHGYKPLLFAGANLFTGVVSAISQYIKVFSPCCFLSSLRHFGKLPPVTGFVSNLVRDDEVVLTVDRCLNVVSNHPGATTLTGH